MSYSIEVIRLPCHLVLHKNVYRADPEKWKHSYKISTFLYKISTCISRSFEVTNLRNYFVQHHFHVVSIIKVKPLKVGIKITHLKAIDTLTLHLDPNFHSKLNLLRYVELKYINEITRFALISWSTCRSRLTL